MRFVLVCVLSLLAGCAEVAVGLVLQVPQGLAENIVEGAIAGEARRQTGVDRDLLPVTTSEADKRVIAEARALTRTAVTAAARGDCKTVVAIHLHVMALPDVQLEGGVHDTIFLREPTVVGCLRAAREKPM